MRQSTRIAGGLGAVLFFYGAAARAGESAAMPAGGPGGPLEIVAAGFSPVDTAWMLLAAAMVLVMTAPGLALFYGGLVRKKNILSTMMQCIFLMGVMSLVWAAWGYSFAFGKSVLGGFVGGGEYVGLQNVVPIWEDGRAVLPMHGSVPRSVHMVFEMMFFIFTPALICGAFAERMKFSTMVVFSVLWGTVVYCPIAHWVWSEWGWLHAGPYETFDFAGGTVVHVSSGMSALMCALLLGRRLGFRQEAMPPHNLTYTCLGAALLWMGWFGFNAGNARGMNPIAVNAFVCTQLAAAAGVLAWAGVEWLSRGKPSTLGACSGAVAGLVGITPACGTVTPRSAVLLGVMAALACYYACTKLKARFGYDDSLDAFGVHGVGGVVGALLTGVFATRAVTGDGEPLGLIEGNARQVWNQSVAVIAVMLLAVVGTAILLKLLDRIMGLRVSQEKELQGLDLSQHGEEGYIFL